MTAANTTNQVNLLKRMWGPKLQEPLLKASKLVMKMKKDTGFGGDYREVVVKVAPTAGSSPNFAAAVASAAASVPVKFLVPRKKQYSVFFVDGEAVAATEGDAKAYLAVLKNESNSARYTYARAVARLAARNGGGALGVVESTTTTSSTTLKLNDPTTHVNFDIGMQLEASDDDGTAASPAGLRGSPTYLTVSAIDRTLTTPTLTLSGTLDSASWQTGDFLFERGSYGGAMTGIDGWAPSTAPSASESFMGIDRTDYDLQRVSGFRYAGGTGGLMSDILLDACARANECGIDIDTFWVGARRFATFQKELGTQRVRDKTSDGGIGYQSIDFPAPIGNGTIEIIHEKDLKNDYGWGFNMADLKLATAGESPRLLNYAGNGPLLTAYDADALQGRLGSYGNFIHENPGNSLIVTW